MKLVFIGTGYVGLVSGVMLASGGAQVACIDKDIDKISALKQGKSPIYEPGIDQYITQPNNLFFCTNYKELPFTPDAVFITVGTPPLESGGADLSYVFDASLQAAENTSETTLIVIKSTVPPGTANNVQNFLESKGYKHKVVSNPEFLREGKAVYDFLNPDRIVIGTQDSIAKAVMKDIYAKFDNLLFTDTTTSELVKYASNSFLATKIAFINEMANICEKVGGDIDVLSHGMGLDKRIAPDFLKVGPGFGGSCFPKDILALNHLAKECSEPFYVLSAVIESNKKRPHHIVERIKSVIGDLRGKKLTALGLAFKADTDDIRSSPAIDIIQIILEQGGIVTAYDPQAMQNTKASGLQVNFANSIEEAVISSEAIIILTEWQEFKNINYKNLGKNTSKQIIFDFRNILDISSIRESGFKIYQLGKINDN